jgi:hypothetical protein
VYVTEAPAHGAGSSGVIVPGVPSAGAQALSTQAPHVPHPFPHSPQLFASVVVSTQEPPHSVRSPMQTQAPPTHSRSAPHGLGQSLPVPVVVVVLEVVVLVVSPVLVEPLPPLPSPAFTSSGALASEHAAGANASETATTARYGAKEERMGPNVM